MASYVVSLPERLFRAAAAGGGGLLLETADHILPPAARDSKFYQCTIARPFRITVEFVGGVEGRFPSEMSAPELVKRKVAGNVVEFGCVFTVGFSPLWFLAAASDVSNGSRAYLNAFVGELKRVRVLPESTDVATVDDLLALLDAASSQAADAIDIPPAAVADMRDAVDLLREHAELIPGPERLADVFSQLNDDGKRAGALAAGRLHPGGRRSGGGRCAAGQRSCPFVLHRCVAGASGRREYRGIWVASASPTSRQPLATLTRAALHSRPDADSAVPGRRSIVRPRLQQLVRYQVKHEPGRTGYQRL